MAKGLNKGKGAELVLQLLRGWYTSDVLMRVSGLTDRGIRRENNEDHILYEQNEHGDWLLMVCDGIGGQNSGQRASEIAVQKMKEAFSKAPEFTRDHEVEQWIRISLNHINESIFSQGLYFKSNRGMGTTASGVLISKIGTYIFNVGDSRVYARYDDGLIQMSEDHSWINELIKKKQITPEQAKTHEKKNMLTNGLGIWKVFRIDVNKIGTDYRYLLLCTDGLHGYVEDQQIDQVLLTSHSIHNKCRMLINLANRMGGFDNCSVIIVDNEND